MGSFNIVGFYTNQMISYGNPVVAFLCCEFDTVTNSVRGSIRNHYSIPLSMPIFGEYDDYGGIENIQESPVTKKIEEFFGYDIETVAYDVTKFTIDRWFEPWNRGRYAQIVELRQKDPNDDFMKEEFDRYAPKYDEINDLLNHGRLFGKIENFNVFWAIDHAALWKAFTKVYDADDGYSGSLSYIQNVCAVKVNEYDAQGEIFPEIRDNVLYICKEPSMTDDFSKFLNICGHNLAFKFKVPCYAGQEYDSDEYYNLNKMIIEDTKD